MGNIASMARASTALDSYVAELGNDISYDKSLSSSRFLKTILARHAYGPIVLKIFIKPDGALSLRPIQRRLKAERDSLADLASCNTYQTFVETEKAGYLIRQWVGSNLYDRVSTQPYLARIEKKWIAFQLLTCLRDARTRKVGHGDIKSENVLLTTDLTLLLTDFSSAFKPTYLPLDDPSDFSFFFDTSSRRTCYIAPERFYEQGSKIALEREKRLKETQAQHQAKQSEADDFGKRDGRITEEMDVFSAGCVLAEMWTDGRTVFNLSELYAYREGTVDLEGLLGNIDDDDVKVMISQMLARDAVDRPSFDHILSSFRSSIFPEYFYTFLKDYSNSLSELPDGNNDEGFLKRAASLPGTKVDRLLAEWDSVSVHLENGVDTNGPALLLLNIVTSSIRNCTWPTSRLHGLQLFLNLSPHLLDEDKIDRIVPFIVELLSDDSAAVRAEACRVIFEIVSSIGSVNHQNATYIPEYLLPQMRQLAVDSDVFVRTTYARGLVRLADASIAMLEVSQASKANPIEADTTGIVEPDYDSMLSEIQSAVEDQATTLLVDPSSQVKRAMLASIADLCLFFGRQKSNETVLSHIMTYLNDRDWLLRLAFFDGIVGVGAFIGLRAVEEYVLPLMFQALADPEEAVVARVIASLTSLTSLGLLSRMKLWDGFYHVRGFLCHPDSWIRQGTAGFIAAAARNLPQADVWCILYPSMRPLLQADVLELDEASILSTALPPLSRATMNAAKIAALQNNPPGFWKLEAIRGTSKANLVKYAQASPPESHKLRDKGFSAVEEKKIMAMRDFIVKQAHAARARESAETSLPGEAELVSGKSLSLQDLKILPHTVFISPRTVDVDAKADLRRLRPLLGEQHSRRTSVASRSNRGDDPVQELRKRLASLEPARTPERTTVEQQPEQSPADSTISSTLDLASVPRGGRKKVDQKAAPAVAANHTNAVGTTSIHDESLSGRMTPTPAGRGPVAPYSSSYEGQDPGVRAFLEQVDLENYREPLLDFGPRIPAGQRKRAPRAKSTTSQGVTMIGHLTEHTRSIVAIVTSPDQVFFATASEDGTVCIWDSARLERSVSAKPRLTFVLDSGAPITSMCGIENTYCLAIASEDGQVHILRVHAAISGGSVKYGRIESIRSWQASETDGHVKFISHLQDSTLLVYTSTSVVAKLDIRTMSISSRLQHPLEYGVISAVCPSTHWVIVGTTTGTLSLWDLRFGLIVKSWRVAARITSMALHPARGRGLWIMVSTVRSDNEVPMVQVYDIETSKLVETYEVRASRPTSKVPTNDVVELFETKAALIAELSKEDGAEPDPERSPTVLSFIVGQSFASLVPPLQEGLLTGPERSDTSPGWMVTAGEDRVVRYWDLIKAGEGFVVCGSQKEKDVTFKQTSSTPTTFYTLPNPQRHSSDRHAGVTQQRQPLRPHYDAICALGSVETPFSSCVISGDRSGVVKVWRMEGVDKSSRG